MSDRPLISFDWAMKKLLRQKANHNILNGFLSELFRFTVTIDSILESESNQQDASDKQNRIDIVARNQTGGIILIEMQYNYEMDFLHRMLYGVSKTIVDYVKKGDRYLKVEKIYSVNILYFSMGKGSDYVYHGTTNFVGLHTKDILSPSQFQIANFGILRISDIYPEYYILRVDDFDKVSKDSLDEWLYYLKYNKVESNFSAKGLDLVKAQLQEDSLSLQEKKELEYHRERLSGLEKAVNTALDQGFFDGKNEGIKEGIALGEKRALEKATIELIESSFRLGLSVDLIATLTKTEPEYIEDQLVKMGLLK